MTDLEVEGCFVVVVVGKDCVFFGCNGCGCGVDDFNHVCACVFNLADFVVALCANLVDYDVKVVDDGVYVCTCNTCKGACDCVFDVICKVVFVIIKSAKFGCDFHAGLVDCHGAGDCC